MADQNRANSHKPTGDAAAQVGAVAAHTASVNAKGNYPERECSIAEVFRLQTHGRAEKPR